METDIVSYNMFLLQNHEIVMIYLEFQRLFYRIDTTTHTPNLWEKAQMITMIDATISKAHQIEEEWYIWKKPTIIITTLLESKMQAIYFRVLLRNTAF